MTRPKRFAALLVVLSTLPSGCSHNPTTDELAQDYLAGMTRSEATRALEEPMRVVARPDGGWQQDRSQERAGLFAARFEREHHATVQTCEMYWVSRGFMGMGIWWDYLFYGPGDQLLGFHRRFID